MRVDIVVSLVEGWFTMFFPIDLAIVERDGTLPVQSYHTKSSRAGDSGIS
jgi:hypothetical protein